MSVKTFDQYISPRDLKAAATKFAGKSDLEIIEAAKLGDSDALNALFYLCIPVIAAAFYKFFLGDKKYWRYRINQGDDSIWAGEVYTKLQQTAASFINAPQGKRGKASELASEDVKKMFQGYLYLRLKALAIHKNTVDARQGITGVGKKENPNVSSIDNVDAEGASSAPEISVSDGFVAEHEAQDLQSRYLELLKKEYPDLYDIIILKIKSVDTKDIIERLGIQPWKYHDSMRKASKILKDFMAE
jgi:hypothetical protein